VALIMRSLRCQLSEQLGMNPIESPIAENYHDIVFSQQRHQPAARLRRHSTQLGSSPFKSNIPRDNLH
jgi:hypothetical protein